MKRSTTSTYTNIYKWMLQNDRKCYEHDQYPLINGLGIIFAFAFLYKYKISYHSTPIPLPKIACSLGP